MGKNQSTLDDSDILNEPIGHYIPKESYSSTSLRISSFELLEAENRTYSLSLKPIERWKYLHHLNLNAFGKDTELLTDFGNKIKINQ